MPVERIAFGTMTLGYHGHGARVHDASTARQMLDLLHGHGRRELDTCYVYGDGSCEQMLGDLQAARSFEIAIRYDPLATERGHEPDVLRASLRSSLDRLRTDRADRSTSTCTPGTPWEDTLRTVHELHAEGTVTGGAFAAAFGDDGTAGSGSRFDGSHAQGAEYRRRYRNAPYLRGTARATASRTAQRDR